MDRNLPHLDYPSIYPAKTQATIMKTALQFYKLLSSPPSTVSGTAKMPPTPKILFLEINYHRKI